MWHYSLLPNSALITFPISFTFNVISFSHFVLNFLINFIFPFTFISNYLIQCNVSFFTLVTFFLVSVFLSFQQVPWMAPCSQSLHQFHWFAQSPSPSSPSLVSLTLFLMQVSVLPCRWRQQFPPTCRYLSTETRCHTRRQSLKIWVHLPWQTPSPSVVDDTRLILGTGYPWLRHSTVPSWLRSSVFSWSLPPVTFGATLLVGSWKLQKQKL